MPGQLPTFDFPFSKKAWRLLCKTGPDPIWMAWSSFGQTHLVLTYRLRQNSISPLSVSHFQTRLRSSTDGPDHISVQTQPRSDLVLAGLCEDLAKRIRFGSKPVCKNFRDLLILDNDSEPSRIGCEWDQAYVLGSDQRVRSRSRPSRCI